MKSALQSVVLYSCRYIRYSNKEHQISVTLPLRATGRTTLKETHTQTQSCQCQNKASCLSSFLNRGQYWERFHMTAAVNSQLHGP